MLTAQNTVRVISEDNADLFSLPENPFISLKLEANGFESLTGLRFGEGFSAEHGINDAHFLAPMAYSFAYLFTQKDGNATFLNSLPLDFEETIHIPIAVGAYQNSVPYSGHAELTWEFVETLPAEWEVILQDNQSGLQINLRDEEKYLFSLSPTSTASLSGLEDLRRDGTPVMDTQVAEQRFTLTISSTPTSTPVNEFPQSIALRQNYPNPFNPTTSVSFDLPEATEMRLDVYNIQGQRVATLVNGAMSAGTHSVTFDASSLSSGVYVYRLQAGNIVLSRKMTLIK